MTQSFNTAAEPPVRIPSDAAALYWKAVEASNKAGLENLLDQYPALVGAKSPNTGGTGVVEAAKNGDVDMVKLLHGRGADLKASDNGDQSGMFYAGLNGHREVAQYLIDNRVDATARNRSGMSAVDAARGNDFLSFADELVRMNAKAVMQRCQEVKTVARDLMRNGMREDLQAPPTAVFRRKPRQPLN